jgi:hypothetical protein
MARATDHALDERLHKQLIHFPQHECLPITLGLFFWGTPHGHQPWIEERSRWRLVDKGLTEDHRRGNFMVVVLYFVMR